MASVPKSRVLPSKEAGLFRQVLQLYEQRQHKKALKIADTILKRFPEHGETLAMKGLNLYFLDQKDEGHECIKNGLRYDLSSFICWHVYGLYYRSEKNFDEAIKCYMHALKYDPENANILRDLSTLQMQTRQYEALIASRKSLLQQRPGLRSNWTSLAIAYYMVGNYAQAEAILTKFEETLPDEPPKEDAELENSELLLYKNLVIYEAGDVARALEHLDKAEGQILDKLSVLEYRAKYLAALGRTDEAVKAWSVLVKRNPNSRAYYAGLEAALGVAGRPAERAVLYAGLAAQYPKSELPRRIPLDFLDGDAFSAAVGAYLESYLARGVPSTYVNLKPLYADADKRARIGAAAHAFLDRLAAAGAATVPTTYLWTLHYLAQHYLAVGDLAQATAYIDRALEHTPTLVELHVTKARILKHAGDLDAASDTMTVARELDLQDRFVNTKAAKYLMRVGKNDEAIKVVSLFTRNDSSGKGVSDLHEMQAIWFLTEQGEMFRRLGQTGLALKRLHAVKKIVDEWVMEQFDFHQYCARRGTVRAYIELMRSLDSIYAHPYYRRAAKDIIDIYVGLHDRPRAAERQAELAGLDEAERKKAIKKAKRDRAKAAKKEESDKTAGDADPLGRKLEQTATPLDDALAVWKPLAACVPGSADVQQLGFGIFVRQKAWKAAAEAYAAGRAADAAAPWLADAAAQFKDAVAGEALADDVAAAVAAAGL
ncbi:NMDA receptor-regulated protein 1-domain-containing protein [Dipodascopsis tothii]|uniref:NMDA receptor-regulated protein 1-domain-containing protein n=1 Tax=Dipodascopsis tothii TaxID=44089 RepID=UPI0034CFFC24